jgi:hypothetical protein
MGNQVGRNRKRLAKEQEGDDEKKEVHESNYEEYA